MSKLKLAVLYIGVFWLLLMSVASAFAHQQKLAVTTLLFNNRSGLLEVTHKFYLHDAEHAVKDLFSPSANIVSDKLTQTTFIHYVEGQFSVKDLKGKDIALSSVGSEIDGRYFWVYQEVTIPKAIEGIQVSNGALRDLWPSQVNLVNVEGKGALQSLLFEGESDWLTLVLKSK
ncbi:DUF6702 family protein [Shewanella sp. VB17]|uniref:DUF6702 family protein n=1 Tax=Shewanella sp. VB17 TaxID=2739432 RepID=UPI0020B6C7F7|nr:DUF6702 family protein [Shewanella sp. VB17]